MCHYFTILEKTFEVQKTAEPFGGKRGIKVCLLACIGFVLFCISIYSRIFARIVFLYYHSTIKVSVLHSLAMNRSTAAPCSGKEKYACTIGCKKGAVVQWNLNSISLYAYRTYRTIVVHEFVQQWDISSK